jgi:UDP-glucose 4-epimerase
MSVLVLGGAGYIGSHTVRRLVQAGEEVVVADNLLTGHRAAVHEKAKFCQGDIRDEAFLDGVFGREKIGCVIHFAACSLVPESMRDPVKYYDNNLGGAISLVKSMIRNDVRSIIFSSTAAVYGEPERTPIEEGDRTEPTNPYGETKLAMEKLFKWAGDACGSLRGEPLRYVSLRYFNAAGADISGEIGEDHDPESHLIPLILQVPNGKREKISIFGTDYPTSDGTCVRDYIHVTDLADAHIRAMRYLDAGGRSDVFNLGIGKGFSVRETVEAAREVTGRPIPAEDRPRRPGDPARLVASGKKAREILGWKPRYEDLREIIASAWKWSRTHPDGYAEG